MSGVEVRLYEMPLCGGCQAWKRFFAAEETEYVCKPLADLPGDIPAAEAERVGLVASMGARMADDDPSRAARHVAPVVFVVHPEIPGKRPVRWNLLAEGTEPPLKVKPGGVK